MDSLDTEVLKQAHQWLTDGHIVHLATVVKTWGSAPRQAGAMLAVRKDGRLVGSVSGGCIEDDLIARAQSGQLPARPEYFVYGPHWRLLIIGANQTAKALAQIATMLEFQVLVCDPREEFTADWNMPDVTLQPGMPDDAVLDIQTDARTAIVAITHDPKLDDMALLEALRSKAFYVGALGSSRNQTKRRERLLSFDLTEADVDRLHGPVGLQIGSRTPAEIAVAVAAQLVQERRVFEDARVGGLDTPPAGTTAP